MRRKGLSPVCQLLASAAQTGVLIEGDHQLALRDLPVTVPFLFYLIFTVSEQFVRFTVRTAEQGIIIFVVIPDLFFCHIDRKREDEFRFRICCVDLTGRNPVADVQKDVFFRIQPPVRRVAADAPVVLIKRMPFVFGQGLPVVPILRRVIKRGPVRQMIFEADLAELLRGCCAGLFHDSISCLRLFRLFFLIFRNKLFLCFFRDILLNDLFLRIAVLCMGMLLLSADQDFPGRIAAVIMDMFFHTANQIAFFVIAVS